MTNSGARERLLILAIVALALLVFDRLLEQGVGDVVLYIAAVWVASAARKTQLVWAMAAAGSVLTVAGMVILPQGGELWKLLANRGLALCAIWVTAIVCVRVIRVELDIRQREQCHGLIVDSALDAVVAINRQGMIIEWNRQAEAVFGWTRNEALGRDIAQLIMPERYRDAHKRGLGHFLATGEGPALNKRLELSAIRRSGEEFPIELTISPLRLGRHYEFSAFVRDITERRRAEEQIRHSATELERSNRDLDEFAYSASHDLKAPLRAVHNLATWIAEDAGHLLPEQSRKDLQLMQRRIARMDKLLDDLLAYSRVGRVAHELERVDTRQLVGEVIDMLAPAKGFAFVVGELPTLTMQRAPLEQVFRNLIANAIKHHDRTDGRIEVWAQDNGDMTEFVVRDDGPGIPGEYHDKVFEMFQTLKPRDEMEGSGMGLALVKKIVEHEGGTVTLESTAGRGATFRFTWPKKGG